MKLYPLQVLAAVALQITPPQVQFPLVPRETCKIYLLQVSVPPEQAAALPHLQTPAEPMKNFYIFYQ